MYILNIRDNVPTDILQGCVVVLCTLCAFIGLVWLREQILHGGGPDWLEQELNEVNSMSHLFFPFFNICYFNLRK